MNGYTNVDKDSNCNPDIVADLEQPLPFDDSSVDEIIMCHILEHLGQDTKTYLSIWQELYRILKNKGEIKITVPHWNHENFHHDPTHVRKVTPIGIDMFSQERNAHQIKTGGSETTLGLQLNIDIGVTEVGYVFMPWFESQYKNQPRSIVEREMNKYNNACAAIQINAMAYKPARGI